jgi:tetratricopeptide (TPR) repeat protein
MFTIIVASGCVTGEKKAVKEKDIFETSVEKVVVQRIDSKETVVSPFGKNHWMDARVGKATSIKRIHALLATGESLAAEKESRKFLAAHPGNAEGLTALASALAQSGQYDIAAYYAKLVAAKFPENPHSLNIQGLSILIGATRIEEFRRAESLFQRAFDGSDSEVAAGLNLGDLYLELGNSDSALKIFNTVRSRCHDCNPAVMGFGVASRRLGHYSEALDAFKMVVSNNKSDVEAMYHIALIYRYGLKDRKKAEETLRALMAANSDKSSVKERAQTVLRSMLSEVSPAKTALVENQSEQTKADGSELVPEGFDLSKENDKAEIKGPASEVATKEQNAASETAVDIMDPGFRTGC